MYSNELPVITSDKDIVIIFDGKNITGKRCFQINEAGISRTYQVINLFKKMKNSDEIIVDEAMKKCGIFELRNRSVKELSGGEKQKTYIAMTLAQETPNILLDEPMAHLDAKSASEIQNILNSIKKEKTVLVITHDIISALKNSDKIAILNNKKIAFAGTPEQCLESKAIEKAFGTQIVMFNDSGEKYYSLK